ncbi:MAG: hypothetical protein L0099_13865 [Acidobacteria bacterium]|nr:hypothetical protein [Acidobacteriota bacterium]
MAAPPTPQATDEFEKRVAREARELGRQVLEQTYNHLEPQQPQDAPGYVDHEGGQYRRLSAKTPQRHVATLCGKITLWRRGYRFVNRDVAERTIFPLEMALGLVHNATPALAEVASRAMAQAGATQSTVLARLREDHGLNWSARTLRAVTQEVEARMTPGRRTAQVAQVLQWLQQAWKTQGKYRPTVSVGRDGITLASRPHGFWEVATVSTVTVYDRQGRRLGSVYLGFVPQLGQQTMSDELTALLRGILEAGPDRQPRWVYLTDAGDQECAYFSQLRRLRHPRTRQRLSWQRILDYYHASQRLTVMGEALFGPSSQAAATWASKMRKLLKKSNGVFRVLHSAAALRARGTLCTADRKRFQTAYNYLRKQARYLRYHSYRQAKLPIGSGVTEAACKTLYTQRLKLSGMRWSKAGAQVILNLRAIYLSGVWKAVHRATLCTASAPPWRTPAMTNPPSHQNAA